MAFFFFLNEMKLWYAEELAFSLEDGVGYLRLFYFKCQLV